jgi:prevent-host-death family protein
MAKKIPIKASEAHRAFGKLLKRVFGSDDHLVIERDGFPVAVIMSYQEYEKLDQQHVKAVPHAALPPVMSLEEAFGSVQPISRPEDFKVLRDMAIEDHLETARYRED